MVCERERVMACAKRFLGHEGIAVAFQRDAWNHLRSDGDPAYSLDAARRGRLRGSLGEGPGVPLFGVPPTRFLGPSRKALRRLILAYLKGDEFCVRDGVTRERCVEPFTGDADGR